MVLLPLLLIKSCGLTFCAEALNGQYCEKLPTVYSTRHDGSLLVDYIIHIRPRCGVSFLFVSVCLILFDPLTVIARKDRQKASPERIARKDSQKGLPERITRKDSQEG